MRQTCACSYLFADVDLSAHLKKTIKEDQRVIHRLRKEQRAFDDKSDVDTMNGSTESLIFHDEVEVILKLARTIRKEEAVPHVQGNIHLRRGNPSDREQQEERRRAEAFERGREAERRRLDEEWRTSQRLQGSVSQRPQGQRTEAAERRLRFEEQGDTRRNEQSRESSYDPTRRRLSRHVGSDRPTPNSSPSEAPNVPHDRPQWSVEEHSREHLPRASPSEEVSRENESDIPMRSHEANSSEASAGSRRTNRNIGRQGSDFTSVCALPETLKMMASNSAHRVQGYIEGGDGRQRSVTAILEPEQTFNFMTDKKASELSLLDDIEPYTVEEGGVTTWIESVGGRRIEPLGKIQILWSMAQQSHHDLNAFSLQFWVFPYHPERDLVLGGPFVSKSNYYSRRRTLS